MTWTQSLLFFCAALAACATAPGTHPNDPVLKNYLALGDSYTVAESIDSKNAFPEQLVDSLNRNDKLFNAPEIIARTGWTTHDLLAAAKGISGKDHSYELVTLLIGVNDEYAGDSPENYRKTFAQTLALARRKARADSCIIVLSIPDYGVTPFGRERGGNISERIDLYNAISKEICSKENITWIDITGYSRQHPSEVATDGLHPSATQYSRWVQRILKEPFLLRMMQEESK